MRRDRSGRPGVGAAPAASKPPTLTDKVDYLRDRAFGRTVEAVETHFSWVFLTEDRAFKLKKPIHHLVLDHRSLASRRADCEAEVRLNQALAPGVYLGTLALTADAEGTLALEAGEVVDWLVVMRRLPDSDMLDARLRSGSDVAAELEPLVEWLVSFYRNAEQRPMSPPEYRAHLLADLEADRAELLGPAYGLDRRSVDDLVGRLVAVFEADHRLAARGEHLVDGHGDLRPEHVSVGSQPLVIDRLSFSADLRRVDPLDDLALLAIECTVLGRPDVGQRVLAGYRARRPDEADDAVVDEYRARRALMRARLAIAHLRDPEADTERWRRRALRYVQVAADLLAG